MVPSGLCLVGFILIFIALAIIISLTTSYLPRKSNDIVAASNIDAFNIDPSPPHYAKMHKTKEKKKKGISERNRRTTNKKYKVEHVEYISSRSFEQVVTDFEGLVGSVENGSLRQLVMTAKTKAEFEAGVHALEGASGFLQFLVINHGAYLPFFGIVGKKVQMYTIGNPLIAVTMLQYDIRAALNVPVRLVIYENSADNTVRLGYDLPSSLMSQLRNNKVTTAAKKLDAKLEHLCKRATGASDQQV